MSGWPYTSAHLFPTETQEHTKKDNEMAVEVDAVFVPTSEKYITPQFTVVTEKPKSYTSEFVNTLDVIVSAPTAQPIANVQFVPSNLPLGFDAAHTENLSRYDTSAKGLDPK